MGESPCPSSTLSCVKSTYVIRVKFRDLRDHNNIPTSASIVFPCSKSQEKSKEPKKLINLWIVTSSVGQRSIYPI